MTEDVLVPMLNVGEMSGSCKSGVDICESANDPSDMGVRGLGKDDW